MNKKTIEDIEVRGKRILMRVDYNVPLDESLNITDDARIRETLPTLRYLLDRGASLVLMAHLGRPKGKFDESMSLSPAAKRLGELLGFAVKTAKGCVGAECATASATLRAGEVLLLENLRFHSEEEANDEGFAHQLAEHGEIYVNDAFGSAANAHASTDGVARVMRLRGQPCVAGLLMAREIDFLGQILENPARPFVAIMGGVKVSDKIKVIRNLLTKVDTLLVGGAMSYAFASAQGFGVGTSYFKKEDKPIAGELLLLAKSEGYDFRLPSDVLITDRDAEDAVTEAVPVNAIPADKMGMDIGPATIADFVSAIDKANTVLWNGPMGRFEMTPFANGTRQIAEAVGRATARGAITVIGGGDSAAAVKQMGLSDKMTHVSTGGGASLKFLEGDILPSVAVLDDKE